MTMQYKCLELAKALVLMTIALAKFTNRGESFWLQLSFKGCEVHQVERTTLKRLKRLSFRR